MSTDSLEANKPAVEETFGDNKDEYEPVTDISDLSEGDYVKFDTLNWPIIVPIKGVVQHVISSSGGLVKVEIEGPIANAPRFTSWFDWGRMHSVQKRVP